MFLIAVALMGLGAFPASDKRFLGLVGMHGTYEANLAMHIGSISVVIPSYNSAGLLADLPVDLGAD